MLGVEKSYPKLLDGILFLLSPYFCEGIVRQDAASYNNTESRVEQGFPNPVKLLTCSNTP